MGKADSLDYLEATLNEAERVLDIASKAYSDALIAVVRLRVQKDMIFLASGRMLGNDGLLIDTIMATHGRKPT